MNWEQKMAALSALCGAGGAALHMRAPGDWYLLLPGVEVGGDGMLRGLCGDGRTPEGAVERAWDEALDVKAPRYLSLYMGDAERRKVRWTGFMWRDVQ